MGSFSVPIHGTLSSSSISSHAFPRHGTITQEFVLDSLFQDGADGIIVDPSDPSNMFQDTGGNTPVASDGDSIALIEGVNGTNLVQSDDSLQPTYHTDGETSWISGDASTEMGLSSSLTVETMVCAEASGDVTTEEPSTEQTTIDITGDISGMLIINDPLTEPELSLTTGLLGLI